MVFFIFPCDGALVEMKRELIDDWQKLDWKMLAHREELVDVVLNLHQNNGRRPGD